MNVKKIRFDTTSAAVGDEFGGIAFDVEFLEKLVYEWIRRMIFYSEFRLSNSIIQSMAIQFKLVLHMHWFFPSMEWLDKFRFNYKLNEMTTRTLSIGYKEGKSVKVRDIVRELLHAGEFKDNSELKVVNEPIETAIAPNPAIEIIEIDDEVVQKCEIIEIEDDAPIAELLIADELDMAHELLTYDNLRVPGELPASDKGPCASELPDAYKTQRYGLLDIEDELPKSVCTKYGSTIVQTVQAQRESPPIKLDIEDYIPSSVCTSALARMRPLQSESLNTQGKAKELKYDKVENSDTPGIKLSSPAQKSPQTKTITGTKIRRKCQERDLKRPMDCESNTQSTVPAECKKPTRRERGKVNISKSGSKRAVEPEGSKIKKPLQKLEKGCPKGAVRIALKAAETRIPQQNYIGKLEESGPKHAVPTTPKPAEIEISQKQNVGTLPIANGFRQDLPIWIAIPPNPAIPEISQTEPLQNITTLPGINIDILSPLSTTPKTAITEISQQQGLEAAVNHKTDFLNPVSTATTKNTQNPTTNTTKKSTRFSKRGPLKTRDEALKCIKLMEDFAMMKENFRLIGFIERLEKLIRIEKRKRL